MIRFVLTAVVLLLGSLPASSQDNPDQSRAEPAALGTLALERFIEPKSCIVAEIDIDQIDTDETLSVIRTVTGDRLAPAVTHMIDEGFSILRRTGVHRGYVIASPASLVRGSPVVVLPCNQPDELQSMLQSFAKKHLPPSVGRDLLTITKAPASESDGPSFVLLGTGEAVQHAIDATGTLRPDFADPLAAKNHLAHTMIVSLAPETRRDLMAFWPSRMPARFPVQFSPRRMVEDIDRVVISADLPPNPALQVRVTAQNAEAAKRVGNTTEKLLSLTGPFRQNIHVEYDGSEVHVSTDLQPLLQALGQLVAASSQNANQLQNRRNLIQVGLAIHHYADVQRHLPPRCFTDPASKPLHSWRVAILPFLEQRAVYDSLNLKEPWNSPENQNPAAIMIPIYANDAAGLGRTTLRAPVMKGSLWQGNGPPKQFRDITDGTPNTIAVIDAPKSAATAWANPEPWIISAEDPMSDIFGDRDAFTALFLDGSVVTFKKSGMTNERLRAMLTIAASDEI
ncbi:MAG: DUF1559 domain-containing protein [Rubripirellula sp.]|nr:DUF1559 domain-containing protein [Rubripirellula sp.]